MSSPRRSRSHRLPSQPKCTIQRLIIVHQKLADESGLDEGATLEELSEEILYYHDVSSTLDEPQRSHYASNQAVKFAGLCSALQSLPNALTGQDGDGTEEVFLSNATLVFVPLESAKHGIIAVAQVERSTCAQSSNPLAIRTSIQRCHDMFCLLRRGIHETLLTGSTDQSFTEDVDPKCIKECRYPGMAELYGARKKLRRTGQKLSKTKDPQLKTSLMEETAVLEEQLQRLLETLPIVSLRTQLRTHYDEYLAHSGLVSAATGVSYPCLVEAVPAPIVKPSATLVHDCPVSSPGPCAALCLGKAVQSLLDSTFQHRESHEPLLLGVSSFFCGQLVYTHTPLDQHSSPMISPKTACVLMDFMASYRRKIFLHSLHSSALEAAKTPSPPRNSGIRRFLSASLMDEDTVWGAIDDVVQNESEGRFLSPPPLSMLNVSDRVLQADLPSHGSIWTPLIYLPSRETHECSMEVNLVLFDIGDYSFLLYLSLGESAMAGSDSIESPQSVSLESDTGDIPLEKGNLLSSAVIPVPAYSRLLEMVALDLSDCAENEEVSQRLEIVSEPGQYVVFVDRVLQRLVLLSNDDEKGEGRWDAKKSARRHEYTSSEAFSSLDCRHLLASSFPSEVVASFDDVMNEVHGYEGGHVLQLCTYLPQGWVYAHAQNDQELYMFFRANKFVTVSDVHHAADRMRAALFNESHG